MRSVFALVALVTLSLAALSGCGPAYLDPCQTSDDCGAMRCVPTVSGGGDSCVVDGDNLQCVWICTSDDDCKDAKAGATPLPKCTADCSGRKKCGVEVPDF